MFEVLWRRKEKNRSLEMTGSWAHVPKNTQNPGLDFPHSTLASPRLKPQAQNETDWCLGHHLGSHASKKGTGPARPAPGSSQVCRSFVTTNTPSINAFPWLSSRTRTHTLLLNLETRGLLRQTVQSEDSLISSTLIRKSLLLSALYRREHTKTQ